MEDLNTRVLSETTATLRRWRVVVVVVVVPLAEAFDPFNTGILDNCAVGEEPLREELRVEVMTSGTKSPTMSFV